MRSAAALCVLGMVALLYSCTERDKHGKPLDEPTSGTITVAVDESLRPLIEAEANAFEAIYREAHLTIRYLSEGEAIKALLQDSARLAIVTRKLRPDENDLLMKENIEPIQTIAATGALALIIHNSNPDSLLTVRQLRDIMDGTVHDWKQLNKLRKSEPIQVIFDNPASGSIRFLRDSIHITMDLPSNCYALKNNQAVVDYVSQHVNAIGLIGVEWISDRQDSTANRFLRSIRVMSLASDTSFYKPYQAYMALHQYPLCRNVIIISREARAGLGTGFSSFIASDKGQRIVLKAGLVPATMPIRIVEVNTEDDF